MWRQLDNKWRNLSNIQQSDQVVPSKSDFAAKFPFLICLYYLFRFLFFLSFWNILDFLPGRLKETNPDSKEGSTEDPIPDAHLHFFLSLLLSLCFPVVVFLNVCVSLFVVYVRLFFFFLSSGGFSIFWGINTSLGIRFYKFSLRIKQIKTRRDNQAMYVSALFFYVFGNAGKHAKEMRFWSPCWAADSWCVAAAHCSSAEVRTAPNLEATATQRARSQF